MMALNFRRLKTVQFKTSGKFARCTTLRNEDVLIPTGSFEAYQTWVLVSAPPSYIASPIVFMHMHVLIKGDFDFT